MRVLIERRAVAGFPAYEVSADGRVFSTRKNTDRELRAALDAKGYLCLTICDGRERRRSVRVHRLVAETFIPNPDGLPCVRHLDGNPRNNGVGNLAWGTYQQNEDDKRGHGTWDLRRNGKLTLRDREIARRLAESGVEQKVIANALSVSRPTITRLVNRTIWGNDQ